MAKTKDLKQLLIAFCNRQKELGFKLTEAEFDLLHDYTNYLAKVL